MAKRKRAPDRGDLGREHPRGCWFDADSADRICVFFEQHLVHSKGRWAGSPFTLQDWQRRMLREAFGWKTAAGIRQYSSVFLGVPKKNGKSTLAAGVALYLASADFEAGAEVYTAAADKDQARIVYDEAVKMRDGSAALRELSVAYRKPALYFPEWGSRLEPLSSNPETKHGFNPHGIVIDELHAWPTRDLYDFLVLGVAARTQPMVWVITTAGSDRKSICYEKWEYSRKVRDGIIDDPTWLPVLFEASPDDDWHSPATWKKANPSLGTTIQMDYFERAHQQAAETPSGQNAFKRLHLNLWTEQVTRWLSMDDWDACAGPVDEAELEGQECWIGLDLSSTTDLAAMVAVFPEAEVDVDQPPAPAEPAASMDLLDQLKGSPVMPTLRRKYRVLCRFWLPGESAVRRARKDRVPYPDWIAGGHIVKTEGNVIDYELIRREVVEWSERFTVREVAYDPWNATGLAQTLQDDHGLPMVPFRQGYISMSPACKALEGLVIGRRLAHAGQPVLRWNAANVAVQQDPAGNIKPAKDKSSDRIDGLVALIMAIGRAELRQDLGVIDGPGIVVL